MTSGRLWTSVAASLASAALAGSAAGQAQPSVSAARLLYWGDTHVHSSWSLDANMFNNTRLTPAHAYRFARGEAVDTGGGVMAQLARPLDFLVVSDHAESLAVFSMIRADDPLVAGTKTAERVRAFLEANPVVGPAAVTQLAGLLSDHELSSDAKIVRAVWDDVVDLAEQANEPGRFTALVGYEWGSTPDGDNLHRNVIFRDGPSRTRQVVPFSSIDSNDPAELWKYLAKYEAETGGRAIAIPHNPNLSNGRMFALTDFAGQPIDTAYARARATWEPLVEATQIKGDSEAHPFLSPDDEFADFETWDKTNIFGLSKTLPSMLPGSYVRAALKNGLSLQRKVGANPYKFGLIGSTDAHTSLATADDDNYWGKTSNMLAGTERMTGVFTASPEDPALSTMSWEQAAAGYAAVWAESNTRQAVFDALRRREAYSTTGPRIAVRFFGGWGFDDTDATSPDLAERGYARGVPMGGDLPTPPGGNAAPTFLVAAAMDAAGARLERVQIVKGWLGDDGSPLERVIDVAVTTDGAAQLAAVWRDEDFDPASPAFYYLRVLEVTTPRWTAFDAKRYGHAMLEGTRTEHQERAYTSPIWYTPPA